MAHSRLCSRCRAEREAGPEAAATSEDTQGILEAIGRCCSLNRGYITPYTPVKEAVFRIMLASGNEPLTTAQLLAHLEERLSSPQRLTVLTTEVLERLLQNDRVYGFRPMAEVEPTSAEVLPEDFESEGRQEAMALVPMLEVESPELGEEPVPEEATEG